MKDLSCYQNVTKRPRPIPKSPDNYLERLETYTREYREWADAESAAFADFKKGAIDEYCHDYWPHPLKERVFDRAWHDGHSAGLSAVLTSLEEEVDYVYRILMDVGL